VEDMTARKIKEVALSHFAKHGYEGASLANIADDVGIKKPSIYAHFKGKDDLFLHVMQEVVNEEIAFASRFFEQNVHLSLHDRLYTFLVQYKERYEHDEKTKFWLRMSFFPPTHLYDQVMQYVYSCLDKTESLIVHNFVEAMEEGAISEVGAERAAVAFMGVFDSVMYGGAERFARRLDACWHLYWRALEK
jgi:AcrR family transcriptional regulator